VDTATSAELLDRVTKQYLNSGDFNGLYVAPGTGIDLDAAEALIRGGQLEAITSDDFPNPHIRPWANRTPVDDQVAAVGAALNGSGAGVCLYPTAAVLADHRRTGNLSDRPYTERLAKAPGS
jgi:hypothetical protein